MPHSGLQQRVFTVLTGFNGWYHVVSPVSIYESNLMKSLPVLLLLLLSLHLSLRVPRYMALRNSDAIENRSRVVRHFTLRVPASLDSVGEVENAGTTLAKV